eukprot:CAMPEP_0205900564 /NCGR_PEP_ID=MMETSP1083-20121108/27211_1 /ASSEMBLY_ACC=CAM_ASM_000430 /TAXON_ID=97485 /ORGANISM="Prymnesium parvum, Strain Texoma1" /LENGTH=121 /DNA_ID=CAMNT_0053266025 /DNA_START=305 /DNA_END=667 /DNA_ORIENTATION=-
MCGKQGLGLICARSSSRRHLNLLMKQLLLQTKSSLAVDPRLTFSLLLHVSGHAARARAFLVVCAQLLAPPLFLAVLFPLARRDFRRGLKLENRHSQRVSQSIDLLLFLRKEAIPPLQLGLE